MKKKLLFTKIILICSVTVFSQTWSGSTTTTGNTYRTGNVGIGTNNANNAKLTINGDNINTLRLENDLPGKEPIFRLRAKSSGSSYWFHADIAAKSTSNSSGAGFLGFKVPCNNNSGEGYKMIINSNGHVGIGTTSPTEKLHINGGKLKISNGTDYLIIDPHYYVGGAVIDYKPHIILDGTAGLTFWDPTPGQYNGYVSLIAGGILCKNTTNDSYTSVHDMGITMREHNSDSKASVFINTNGNATFSGKVTANEIEVKPNVWSDFVFNKDYNLRSIQEVEQYINENKHLPDVPSETEVIEKGINLGEINATLLQKIEELTLYIIELKKENEEIKNLLKNQ